MQKLISVHTYRKHKSIIYSISYIDVYWKIIGFLMINYYIIIIYYYYYFSTFTIP